MDDTFQQVKEQLGKRPVLFTGTPCQAAGLRAYLGQEYENLLIVQVICHGVPTPKLWQKYIEYQTVRLEKKITQVEFRNKESGWRHYKIRLKQGNSFNIQSDNCGKQYMKMFLRDLCLRPSCYQCPSKGLDCAADMTIGDFWGIETVAPELDDDKGTSLVIAHTARGQLALKQILSKTDWKQVDCGAALQGNPAMLHSAAQPKQRNAFMADMEKLAFPALAKKYVPLSGKEKGMEILQKLGLMPLALSVWKALRR